MCVLIKKLLLNLHRDFYGCQLLQDKFNLLEKYDLTLKNTIILIYLQIIYILNTMYLQI